MQNPLQKHDSMVLRKLKKNAKISCTFISPKKKNFLVLTQSLAKGLLSGYNSSKCYQQGWFDQ